MSDRSATTSTSLPPKALRDLRAKAHALRPVVWISQKGLTEGALREIDRALTAHELIKLHAALDDRSEREALLQSICRDLGAQPVQVIGKMLVAFRPRPAQEPQPAAPPSRAKRRAGARADKAPKRPERSRIGAGTAARAKRRTGAKPAR